jgi:hypothetical protein
VHDPSVADAHGLEDQGLAQRPVVSDPVDADDEPVVVGGNELGRVRTVVAGT